MINAFFLVFLSETKDLTNSRSLHPNFFKLRQEGVLVVEFRCVNSNSYNIYQVKDCDVTFLREIKAK